MSEKIMSDEEQLREFERVKRLKLRKYVNERVPYYITLCKQCSPYLKKLCRSTPTMGVYDYLFKDKESMPWCCHARTNVGLTLSDGSVKLDTINKVVSLAEEFAKESGMKGVTCVTLDSAFAQLANNFRYEKFGGKPPERAEPLPHTHFEACMSCDPEFAVQCFTQAEQKNMKGLVDVARKYATGIWCGHAVEVLASLMLSRKFNEEKVRKLTSLAKKVSEDAKHPGVWTGDLFVALGRACT